MDELIIVRQLPVIEEQLRLIKSDIETKVGQALSMVCTEETVKTVKDIRAELNRDFTALEERRKEVKNKVLSPYEQFELVYKECVTNVFKPADLQLKTKIDEVENGLKEQKRVEVIEFFDECKAAAGIDFITFEQCSVTVTLTASKKSLKDKAKAFVDKVADELSFIDTQECKAEILVEYKKSLNVAQAITIVTNRNKAIEIEREMQEARRAFKENRVATAQKVDKVLEQEEIFIAPIQSPIVTAHVIEDELTTIADIPKEKQYRATFQVTATIEKLKALKQFLEDGGYIYESR